MGRSRIATGGETELMGKRDLRIYALLDTLKESPVLSIKELADRFQVSEMTIRRDIDYLKENRLFTKTRLQSRQRGITTNICILRSRSAITIKRTESPGLRRG